MIPGLINKRFFPVVWLIIICSCSGNVLQTTLFTDGFQKLDPGSSPYSDSANPAIYFNSNRGNIGAWSVATSLREEGFSDAWEIQREGGENFLAQTFTNLNSSNAPLSLVNHPIVVGGDSLWSDWSGASSPVAAYPVSSVRVSSAPFRVFVLPVFSVSSLASGME